MATAVAVAPGTAVLSAAIGGAALVSVANRAVLASVANRAALAGQVIGDAHILTTTPISDATAAVGSAVVGTSTVG